MSKLPTAFRLPLASLLWLSVFSAGYKASPAWGQIDSNTEATHRDGVAGGVGFGLGSLEIGGESHGTLNYALQFGGYITDRWALQIELWGGIHNDDSFHIGNHNRGISAQYWLQDRKVWGKALLGASGLETTFDDITFADFNGVALGGAAGWMFYERASFHGDAQFRMTLEGFENSRDNAIAIAIGVGVSYF